MSTEDKKTDNELIAEFMGLERTKSIWDKGEYAYTIKFESFGYFNKWVIPSDMEFQASWDWLMPVVEKIAKTATYVPYFTRDEVGMDISIHPGACSFNLPDPSEGYNYVKRYYEAPSKFCHNEVSQPTVDCVYKCCVAFIRWYNTQPK